MKFLYNFFVFKEITINVEIIRDNKFAFIEKLFNNAFSNFIQIIALHIDFAIQFHNFLFFYIVDLCFVRI